MSSELQQKFELVKNKISPELQANYHLEAIGNFIFHLNAIENIRTRSRVTIEIDNYLDHILTKDIAEINPHEEFKVNFANTIYYLSSTYSHEVGFISKPFFPFSIGFWIILLSIGYFFFDNYILFGVILIAAITRTIYIFVKIKARKYH